MSLERWKTELRGGENERSEGGSEFSNACSDSEKAAQDPAQYSLPYLSVMKYTEITGIVNKIRQQIQFSDYPTIKSSHVLNDQNVNLLAPISKPSHS